MQLTIKKCKQCKRLTCSKQNRCVICRQREKDYQARRWKERVIVHSRIADRRKNRTYKQEDFITPERIGFLQKLLNNQCIYCKIEMQNTNRRKPNGITVERIDRRFAHVKNNCFLCCYRCNCVGGRGVPGHIIQQCFSELRKYFNRKQIELSC